MNIHLPHFIHSIIQFVVKEEKKENNLPIFSHSHFSSEGYMSNYQEKKHKKRTDKNESKEK